MGINTPTNEPLDPNLNEKLKKLEAEKSGLPPEEYALRRQEIIREGKRQQGFEKIKHGGSKEETTILAPRQDFNSILNSDAHLLRASGSDLAKLLLVDTKDITQVIDSRNPTTLMHRTFTVNFGENKGMKHYLGAGDILPAEVKIITINGRECFRKNESSKGPGYYFKDTNWRDIYQGIFDGDTIEVKEVGALSKEEMQADTLARKAELERARIRDMVALRRQNPDTWRSAFTHPADTDMFSEVEEQFTMEEAQKKWRKELYGEINDTMSEEVFLARFGTHINTLCARIGMPPALFMSLLRWETGNFNPQALNANSGAFGLGQMTEDAWVDARRYSDHQFDIELPENRKDADPYEQIAGSIAYLAVVHTAPNPTPELFDPSTPWTNTIIRYHIGPGRTELPQSVLDQNPGIRNKMRNPSAGDLGGYIIAARDYYRLNGMESNKAPLSIGNLNDPKLKTLMAISQLSELDWTGTLRNPETGTTLCSATACESAKNIFGLDLPRKTSANESRKAYVGSTVPSAENAHTILSSQANVADLFIKSETANGKLYGHRAIAVKATDGEWYVHDPYWRNEKNILPLSVYLSLHPLVEARLYAVPETTWTKGKIAT